MNLCDTKTSKQASCFIKECMNDGKFGIIFPLKILHGLTAISFSGGGVDK